MEKLDYAAAMRRISDESGMNYAVISRELRRASNYMGNTFNSGRVPGVTSYARMLDICGYALCAVPREDIPRGAIVIDAPRGAGDSGAD